MASKREWFSALKQARQFRKVAEENFRRAIGRTVRAEKGGAPFRVVYERYQAECRAERMMVYACESVSDIRASIRAAFMPEGAR